MAEDQRRAPGKGSREISDLIGVELTLGLGAWFLLVLAAFFFIGAVVGIVVIALGVLGFGWLLANAVRNADTSD